MSNSLIAETVVRAEAHVTDNAPKVEATVPDIPNAEVAVPLPPAVEASAGALIHDSKPYEGAYEFVPSREEQVVRVGGLLAKADVVIKPIPSNYGRIEFDGSALYVI